MAQPKCCHARQMAHDCTRHRPHSTGSRVALQQRQLTRVGATTSSGQVAAQLVLHTGNKASKGLQTLVGKVCF